MSFMTAEMSSQIPTVLIMLSVICVVGTVGNLLVIIVYALKHDRLTSTLFILVLAVTDFLACLTLIPGTIAIEYLEWKMRSAFLCKSYYLLNNSFIPFSSLLISCIAFDRYFCLCHPFAKIMTFVRAKRIIGVLVFACLFQGGCSTFLVRIEKVQSTPVLATAEGKNDTNGDVSSVINSTEGDTYECTEVIRVNATMLEYVWYRVTQKIQIVSYLFCILSVTVLYILIYSSVSKVSLTILQLLHLIPKMKFTCIGQFEPEIVNGNGEKCQNNQLLTVHNRTRQIDSIKSEELEPNSNPQRVKDNPFQLNYMRSPTVPSVQLVVEKDDTATDRTCPLAEREELLSNIGQSEESGPKMSRISVPKPIPVNQTPKISIQTELSSGANQVPIEPEGRSCIINGERTRLSRRHLADSTTFQNLKTAAMLFVVAVVYIVAFIPAMLMASELITLYLPVFYLYYVNNAINPIVYGFMNPNFRADIRKLFSQHCFGCT
ncbi:unnamed protein product [Echinostoma caproni]|uniref:G_PROTEIN_RECEP_F1_2 domain-containing protein n=1 Tax=Echinostoma caproni TaxID=27848 RepID=A0A183AEC4_9TREM|nr:unnamed protein product [Echinostoma caproni]